MCYSNKYMFYCIGAMLLLCFAVFATHTATAQNSNSNIEYKIKPYRRNGVYNANDGHIGFFIRLKNKVNDSQRGTILVEVKNSFGQSIHNENISLYMNAYGSFYKELDFDKSKLQPGFYNANLIISTNRSADTITNVFGVEPEKIFPTVNRPYDFTNFWDDAKRELAAVNPAFRIVRRGDMATNNADVYLIEFQSIGNITIRGWLSVPKGRGKYPIIYQVSGYMANLYPDTRSDVAVFSLNLRGNGNSDNTQKLDYNSYLLHELNNKTKYIYRAAYMDALRGLEFLHRSGNDLKLDVGKIILSGEGQGGCVAAAIAGMDNKIKGLIVERPLFMDMRSQFNIGEGQPYTPWPVYAFKDFIYNRKMNRDAFFSTWDYFDPQSFAVDIHCSTLVAVALKSTYSPVQCAYNFYNQINAPKREMYINAESDNSMEQGYYMFQNQWLKEVFRLKN